jgi:mRNA-degrading endonuclease RelE of RelBE toxin-antitoxin system
VSYKVDTIENFQKEAKRLIKKYPSLKNELAELGQQLSQDPTIGSPLGKDCYKIRMSIASKGKGKSGGARIITHLYISIKTVYLLSRYDKSEQSDISDKELKKLIQLIPQF